MRTRKKYLSESDTSLFADLVRAATEVRLNIGDKRIYNDEDVPKKRALAERLDEHALAALKAEVAAES